VKRISGTKWMNDGKDQIRVKFNEFEKYISLGYSFGRIKFSRKPAKYMHLDDKTVRVVESKITEFLDAGYSFGASKSWIEQKAIVGRTLVQEINKISGKRWFTNDIIEMYIIPEKCPFGFRMGRLQSHLSSNFKKTPNDLSKFL
jgi:hypothetical protein